MGKEVSPQPLEGLTGKRGPRVIRHTPASLPQIENKKR